MKHKDLVRHVACWHYCCVVILPIAVLFMKYASELLYCNQ